MRILAFTIGQHHLGLPADHISSVGRRDLSQGKKEKKKAAPALEYNLADAMGVAATSSDQVIVCNLNGRSINLLVEKIIGLVDLNEETLTGWPAILNKIPVFYGVAVADSGMYLLLDLEKISSLKGGPAPAGDE